MIDDLLWQEIVSLREQLKIAADIIKAYDPNFDKEDFLHRLKSVDYDQWIEEFSEIEGESNGTDKK